MSNRLYGVGLSAWLCAAAAALGLEAGREGIVEWSNGETMEGRIALTPGKELALHAGPLLRNIPLATVSEIRLTPEKEEMVRHWRFLEAGQIRKEETGRSYPLRHLKAEIILPNRESVTGHLYTTVLYVSAGDKTDKVVLLSKQRGEEGTSLESLSYPSRIAFKDGAESPAGLLQVRLILPASAAGAGETELCALTWDGLARLPALKGAEPNAYSMPSPLGKKVFVAAKRGGRIYAGWPAAKEETIAPTVREALGVVRDFFDERTLLGVLRDDAAHNVYSLVMLRRRGPTTLEAPQSQPWRLEVWRWRYDEATNRLMLAGRGYFFRGILGEHDDPPGVEIAESLCRSKIEGDRMAIGE